MKKSTKFTVALLSSILIGEVGLYSGGQVKAAKDIEHSNQQYSEQNTNSQQSESDIYIENKEAMKRLLKKFQNQNLKIQEPNNKH